MLAITIINQIFTHKIIHNLIKTFKLNLHKHLIKRNSVWLVLKITMKWKMRLKIRRISESNIHPNNVRFSLTCFTLI